MATCLLTVSFSLTQGTLVSAFYSICHDRLVVSKSVSIPDNSSLERITNSHSMSPLLYPYTLHAQYFQTEPIIPPSACFVHSPLYLQDSPFQVVALLSTQLTKPEAKERDMLDISPPSTPAGTDHQTLPSLSPPDSYHSHVKSPVSALQISFSPHDFCLFVFLILY